MKANDGRSIEVVAEYNTKLLARLHMLDRAEEILKNHGDGSPLDVALVYLELRKQEQVVAKKMERDGLRVVILKEANARAPVSPLADA